MDEYYQDESGQWWCRTAKQRLRVAERPCEQCGKAFINRHPQRFCSAVCRSASQKGVPKREYADLICPECGKSFPRDLPRTPRYGAKYCSRECGIKAGNRKRGRSGPANAQWKGGTKRGLAGYLREYVPGRGYLLQHRIVMERVIGRPLERYEEVHHRNGIRHDNRPENLELWAKRQPGGQRVTDLLAYARWVIETYGPLEQGQLI